MVFLYFIFFTIVAFWLLGLIFRAAVNRWIRRRTEEYNRAVNEAKRQAKQQAHNRRDGEVIIDAGPSAPHKKVSRNVGDYVEFEEVDETCEHDKN